MKNIRIIHIIIFFPLLFGCNSKEKMYTVIDSISLNATFTQINNKVGFGVYNMEKTSGFYYLDNINNTVFLEEGKQTGQRRIISNGQRIDGVAFDGTTRKLYYTQGNNLYQIDTGNICVKIEKPKLTSNYSLSSTTFEIQPKVFNGKALLNIIDTVLRADEKQSYIELCKKNIVLTAQLNDDLLTKLSYVGKFPFSYIAGNHYNNYYTNIEYDGKNLLMSFASNDSVFVKNEKGEYAKHYLGSDNVINDIKPISFEDLKINSRITSYSRNSAKYIKVIYDPYRKQYLRVYQIGNNDLNGNITKWGIVFYNKEFQFLRDVVFEIKNYNYLLVTPCKKGIIISKTLKDYANDKIKFDIISFD